MTKNMYAVILAVLALGITDAAAASQQKQPIEISAQNALEWKQGQKQYVARGRVIARQGDTEIHADEMTADYRDKTGDQPAIYRLTALGNVKIISGNGQNTVTGDHAVYDVDQKHAVMTGQNLRMDAPDQIVTADEQFEYWAAEGRVIATGNAVATRGSDQIAADAITAWLADDANGKRVMTRAEAVGNVVITTPTEKATGSRADYVRATDTATLAGPVTITRGENILNGAHATMNLKTGVSTLAGSGDKGGRVTGVFYTDAKDAAP